MLYSVYTSSAFERQFAKLESKHIEALRGFESIRLVLSEDPYNLSRRYKIKKLKDVGFNDGQWRIRVGDYRVLYDIDNRSVKLHSIKHRKDSYH